MTAVLLSIIATVVARQTAWQAAERVQPVFVRNRRKSGGSA